MKNPLQAPTDLGWSPSLHSQATSHLANYWISLSLHFLISEVREYNKLRDAVENVEKNVRTLPVIRHKSPVAENTTETTK